MLMAMCRSRDDESFLSGVVIGNLAASAVHGIDRFC